MQNFDYKFELEKYNKEEKEYELYILKELELDKYTLNSYYNDFDSYNIFISIIIKINEVKTLI